MVDQLSASSQLIREAFALASTDPNAAIGKLVAALGGAPTAEEKASMAKYAGALCEGIGDLQRAAELYQLAATADPSDAYIHLALGFVYRELGQLEDARATLAHCLTVLGKAGDAELLDAAERAMSKLKAADGS